MKEEPPRRTSRFGLLWILVIFGFALLFSTWAQYRENVESIPYSQFQAYIDQGAVADISIGSDKILGTLKSPPPGHPRSFVTNKVPDPDLVKKLTAAKVKFSGLPENTFLSTLLSWMIPILLLYFIFSFFMRRMGNVSKGGGLLPFGKSRARVYVETGLKTRFEDVAGVDEAKNELREIVNFLRNPARFSKLGGRMPKGVLLVGPPGTGKTLLARAVAGEANVPFFSINGSEFVELFVGLGAARVRDLFEQARQKAPCIVFIDELDALGKARGIAAITGSGNDEKEQTLNQLLAEMDGFDPSQGIIVLAATNRPEVLDPALLRAGRFDRQVLVDKPDRLGREQILRIHLGKIKLTPGIDVSAIAGMTAGFSGADLANLANEAALIATRRGANEVQLRDFTEAIERIVAGVERKSRLLNSNEKKRVAYHEMGHAVVALALGQGEVVHKVSIIPRGIGALGYTMRRPTEDRYLMGREELKTKMSIALGGRSAETIFCQDISTGAGDDLDKATEIARAMVTRYGMDPKLGVAVLEREQNAMLGSHMPVRNFEYSENTAQHIDRSIQDLLQEGLSLATHVLESNRSLMEEAVSILLKQETIDENTLKDLWEKHIKTRRSAPNLKAV